MVDRPSFEIQMKGADLAPETVRASDLAFLLVNLEGAIVEAAKSEDIPLAYETDVALLSLIRVEHGNSSDLVFSIERAISPVAGTLSQAILDRRFDSLPYKAQLHLHELSTHAIKKRWAYEFHAVNGLEIAPAVISYEFPVPKPSETASFRGESSIWGNVYKIGGNPPSVVLGRRGKKLFTATVEREIVDEIQAQRLIYTDIGLIGMATWSLPDWSLLEFYATELADYRPDQVNPAATCRLLGEASQGRWDGVDAAAHVNDLRS